MVSQHVLLIPMYASAHVAAMFRLGVELAKRGVAVTFAALEKDIALVKTFDELQQLHNFNLVSYKNTATGSFLENLSALLANAGTIFRPVADKLVDDQKSGIPGPTCVIGDKFFSWSLDVAKELNVPYYQFFSNGALFAREAQAYAKLVANGTLTVNEHAGGMKSIERFEGMLEIPGLPALRYHELTNPVVALDPVGYVIGRADGVIVNTFYEFEAPQIEAIRQTWVEDCPGKDRRLYLIGPTFKDGSFLEGLDSRGTECLHWLDKQQPHSVVYFSLGSLVRFNPQQMNDLALAVEASGVSFLWVIHGDSREAVPSSFEARMGDRVLIANGWVPQLRILGHPSIGGFVTHCGWSSVLESVTFGVPMVAWPQLRNDQFVNCRYLVDVLKIAVEVGHQDFTEEVPTTFNSISERKVIPEEFARAVRLLVSEEGQALRSRAQDLKKAAVAAGADGGSSKKALDDLAESIPPL